MKKRRVCTNRASFHGPISSELSSSSSSCSKRIVIDQRRIQNDNQFGLVVVCLVEISHTITVFYHCHTNSAEKSYDTIPVRDWMAVHPWVPIVACVLYMVLIPVGQAYFTTRPRWNWRITLAVWNLFLSAFSAVGVIRTLPALWHLYSFYSVEENFCMDPESHFGSGTTGLWVQLFCLSKFPYVYIQSCAHHPMRPVDPV